MDTSHWPQEIVVKPIEEINPSNTYKKHQNQQTATNNLDQTKTSTRAQQKEEQIKNCPRCNSINTKFCYYNNYSLTQPRYFCKTCRRYWTEGGSLRNIPVGGATRKNNKRPSNSSLSSSPTKKIQTSSASLQTQRNPNPKLPQNQNPNQDLNLTFPSSQHFRSISDFSQIPIMENSTSKSDTDTISAMELLNGISSSRGLNSFIPMPNHDGINTIYSSGYHQNLSNLHDFKPSLNFSLDHHRPHHQGYSGNFQENGVHHHHHQVQSNGGDGRVLFPFEDLKQGSHGGTNSDHVEEINRGGNVDSSSGFWSGMLGGGSW